MEKLVRRFRILVLLPLAYFLLASDLQAQTHTREAEFPAVELTYSQLYDIIQKSRHISSNVTAEYPDLIHWETLSLEGAGGVSLGLKHPFTKDDLKNGPTVAYRALYELAYTAAPFGGVIISVRVELNDYYRKLQVAGVDAINVASLFSLLSNDISSHTHWLGGSLRRYWAALPLLALGIVLASLAQIANKLYTKIYLISIGTIMMLSVFALPWQQWLPGAAIYEQPQSFFARYQFTLYLFAIFAPMLLDYTVRWIRGQGTRVNETVG